MYLNVLYKMDAIWNFTENCLVLAIRCLRGWGRTVRFFLGILMLIRETLYVTNFSSSKIYSGSDIQAMQPTVSGT